MIFTKARLLLWGGRLLGLTALVGGIWAAGMNFGLDRGYNKALNEYEEMLDNYNKQWYNTVLERDEEWRASIDSAYRELQSQLEKYREVELREQELLTRLNVLEGTLDNIRNEYENTDFGTCAVSPEFDGLLRNAYQAATAQPD